MPKPTQILILRGIQALLATVVVGVSVTLIRGHHWGSLPPVLGYTVTVGGVTLVAAVVGAAALWFEILHGTVGWVVDGGLAVVNGVGGVFIAIKLNSVSCELTTLENAEKLANNELFNGGCNDVTCWLGEKYSNDPEKLVAVLLGHCKEAQANCAFLFLSAGVLAVTGLVVFLRVRKAGK